MVRLSLRRDTRGPLPKTQDDQIPTSDQAPGSSPAELDQEVLDFWHVWRKPVARAVLPIIDQLRADDPTIVLALVSAPSGFSICHSGLDADRSQRLGELASLVHANGLAATQPLSDPLSPVKETIPLDMITLSSNGSHSVLVAIPGVMVGVLLLWIVTDGTNLGLAVIQARKTAEQIHRELALEESPA